MSIIVVLFNAVEKSCSNLILQRSIILSNHLTLVEICYSLTINRQPSQKCNVNSIQT